MITWIRDGKRHDTKEPLTCPFCSDTLMLRWSTLRAHDDIIQEIMRRNDRGENVDNLVKMWKESPSMQSYVDDMQWKCPTCHYCQMFGKPVSREVFNEMRTARGGSQILTPIDEWYEDEAIKDRLRNLGYW